MARRTLTKKQKFDIQMIYYPKIKHFLSNPNYDINRGSLLKLLDIMCGNLDEMFPNSFKERFDFVDEFKNAINWEIIVRSGTLCSPYHKEQVKKFLSKYSDCLNSKCWYYVSNYSVFYYNYSLIRKYKDKLNWRVLSPRLRVSNEFLLEMKDYIDTDSLFKRHVSLADDIYIQMLKYTRDHFEEVLSYKTKKEKD